MRIYRYLPALLLALAVLALLSACGGKGGGGY
jgi:predicted small lipoprotein YifL